MTRTAEPVKTRRRPDLSFERRLRDRCGRLICGVDEVGRGPLAGPVVAAAVILPDVDDGYGGLPPDVAAAIDDSKRVPKQRRSPLAEAIRAHARVGLGRAEVAEIDALNIGRATFLAMSRAVEALGDAQLALLVDGNRLPSVSCPAECVVGGDGLCLSIAAASVVAKVERDAIMARLALDFPAFGWEANAGYATPAHLRELARLGPTPHHRRSFAPVRQLALEQIPSGRLGP